MTGRVVFRSSQPAEKFARTGDNYMYAHVTTRSLVLFTTVLIIGLVCVPAGAQDIKFENKSVRWGQLPGANPHAFIGTWIVQTQITNCLGTPTENFSKFVSIHAGGTANEISNSLPPSQRTTAFGVWQPLYQRNFVYALRFFRFTPAGTFASTVEAKWSVLLGEEGDSYTAEGAIQVFAPNGTVIANLCGTETGTRFVIPD
jgi:hypothetical protein